MNSEKLTMKNQLTQMRKARAARMLAFALPSLAVGPEGAQMRKARVAAVLAFALPSLAVGPEGAQMRKAREAAKVDAFSVHGFAHK